MPPATSVTVSAGKRRWVDYCERKGPEPSFRNKALDYNGKQRERSRCGRACRNKRVVLIPVGALDDSEKHDDK